jgi:ppGpp synthetase/RelA/SpoT-type nucleotidyltranferase
MIPANFDIAPTEDGKGHGCEGMAWTIPQYTRRQVNDAGAVLINPRRLQDAASYSNALSVIDNWRASHSFPLNTIQIGLKRRAAQIDDQSIAAQRIKRLSSIRLKLVRFPTMKLSQMQDIGGCRAILESVEQVRELVELHQGSRMRHRLSHIDDYIAKPKSSGYRGVHMIYRYRSDKNQHYDDLKIEVQVRTVLQHIWATAVETVGTFIQQALKSNIGEEEWLSFFSLMGTAVAFEEDTAPVPDTPTRRRELVSQIRRAAKNLQVESRLRSYGDALQSLENPGAKAHFFLLKLEPETQKLLVTGFKMGELQQATDQYSEVERAITEQGHGDAVLVAAESLSSLRRAYPNYYLDTRMFLDLLGDVLS